MRCKPLVIFLILGIAVGGCGNKCGRVNATGRLTYKGKPVPSTYVIFQPVEPGKRASHGLTDDDGRFCLTYSRTESGVLLGLHKVYLKYFVTAEEELRAIPPKASKELKATIARFSDPGKSRLQYEIQSDGQYIEINLN